MTTATVTPKYVNAPQPGKKMASINSDGVYYGFDPAKIPITSFVKGQTYVIDYETKPYNGKDYHTITAILTQDPRPVAASGAASTMSKDDWAAKDQFIARQAIAKACIGANAGTDVADMWMDWLNQT